MSGCNGALKGPRHARAIHNGASALRLVIAYYLAVVGLLWSVGARPSRGADSTKGDCALHGGGGGCVTTEEAR